MDSRFKYIIAMIIGIISILVYPLWDVFCDDHMPMWLWTILFGVLNTVWMYCLFLRD